MRQIPFCVVDAFTETPFQGNPAGVFFDDRSELSADDCLQLCAEVSLESAFVQPAPAANADFRLRYFTGVTEVPLCGHATVAALTALVDAARFNPPCELRVLTNVGILPITLELDNKGQTRVTIHQNVPQFAEPLADEWADTLSGALGIEAEAITTTKLPVQVVSTGTPWLLVPVANREAVDNNDALENAAVIAHISRQKGVFGIYLFAIETVGEDIEVWSRCFCPIADLPEDPVTGSASGCLGAYLAEHGVLTVPDGGLAAFTARQGFAGGRGGIVEITVTRENEKWKPAITGTAIVTAAGMFKL